MWISKCFTLLVCIIFQKLLKSLVFFLNNHSRACNKLRITKRFNLQVQLESLDVIIRLLFDWIKCFTIVYMKSSLNFKKFVVPRTKYTDANGFQQPSMQIHVDYIYSHFLVIFFFFSDDLLKIFDIDYI